MAGRTTFAWSGDATQDAEHRRRAAALRLPSETNEVDYVSDINVTAGGPLIKNKVRIFGSFRDWRVHVFTPVQNSQLVLDQTNITSGLVNTTWQVNDDNKVTGFWSRQKYDKPNRLLNNASITVPESTVNEQDTFNLYQGLWNSVLDQPPVHGRARRLQHHLLPDVLQRHDQQSLTDTVTGIIYRNNPTEVERDRNRLQANATRSTTSIAGSAAATSSASASITRTR